MKIRSNKNLWRQVSIKGIVQITVFLLVIFSVTAAICALSSLTWAESWTLVMTPAISLALVILLRRIRSQKQMRGSVLLDAGNNPQRGLFAFIAVTSLVCGGMTIIAMFFESQRTLNSIHIVVYSVVAGTVFLMKAMGSVEFCENGIWAHTGLIPWSSVEAFEWKRSDEWKHSAFWISYKNWLESSVDIKLDIPENEKENVEALLKQHAPSATALHKQLLKPIDGR
jgi:hypothetical protein